MRADLQRPPASATSGRARRADGRGHVHRSAEAEPDEVEDDSSTRPWRSSAASGACSASPTSANGGLKHQRRDRRGARRRRPRRRAGRARRRTAVTRATPRLNSLWSAFRGSAAHANGVAGACASTASALRWYRVSVSRLSENEVEQMRSTLNVVYGRTGASRSESINQSRLKTAANSIYMYGIYTILLMTHCSSPSRQPRSHTA